MSVLNTRIDRSSYMPFYIQVREALQNYIEDKGWLPGEQIPGEPELCQMFDVSRTVVRQALQELEHEGYITRKKGKGTFVAEPKIHEGLAQKLTGFYQDMVERGLIPVTHVLKQQVIAADDRMAGLLKVAPGAKIVEIERLRFVQDEPIVLVVSYLPLDLCPALRAADLTTQSLYDYLERECGLMITHGKRMIEAAAATAYQAKLLHIDEGAPLMRLESVSYLEDDTPIEYYYAFHRGDRLRFEVELFRI